MSIQTTQFCGYIDPVYYQQQQQQQQQQQTYQVSPQHIQRLRHLQQQAALHQQAAFQGQMMSMPQYQPQSHPSLQQHQFQQQQQQQQQHQQQHQPPYDASLESSTESSDLLPSSPGKSDPSKAARRAEHNAIERARREHLNTKFQQLAHSLPNLQNDRRPSKGTIIERTLEFVKHTVQKEERYKNEIRELSKANRQLMRQVTSRSSVLAGVHGSVTGDDDPELDDDHDDVTDFEVDDALDVITTTDDTLSRKSSCSSFAMQSMSSAPTTIGGESSATTSPSLDDYHSMLSQWDITNNNHISPPPTHHQQGNHNGFYIADNMMDESYIFTNSTDGIKSPMNMNVRNNLGLKSEFDYCS